MKRVIVSAPGKVILHGEHAVVYGKKAIAASLGLRTELTLQHTATDDVIVDFPDVGVHLTYSCQSLAENFSLPLCDSLSPTEASAEVISRLQDYASFSSSSDTKQLAVVAFLYVFCSIAPTNGTASGVHISVHSALPTSAGLGSSAAFATCLVTSLLIGFGHISPPPQPDDGDAGVVRLTESDLRLINGWSFMVEKMIHGRPSGIDNSISTYGGALCFKAGHIEQLTAMPQFQILLINTHVPRSTKQLVEDVRQKHSKYADIVDPVLNAIEAITQRSQLTLNALATAAAADATDSFFHSLEELIDMNGHLLNMLGVGHPSLDTVHSLARRHHLHVKLTGAGGGGCAFAIIPPYIANSEVDAAMDEIRAAGYDCFKTSLGGLGVTASVADVTHTSPA